MKASAIPVQNICCIGAGYVGGPTMAVIADRCPQIQVTVVDLNAELIAAWNDPDLSKLPLTEAIGEADMVFISVTPPTKTKGLEAGQASDFKRVEASARSVAKAARGHTIVVEKSTLPVRTAEVIQKILAGTKPDGDSRSFSVLSNPEFLAEGTAIPDLEQPDRVPSDRILTTNLWSSELSKLTANAFLAQRISSINGIAAFCEATGSDVREVAKAIGADSRIGSRFLQAGPGLGGSCFQKDILNLVYLCRHYGLEEVAAYWEQVVTLNHWQQRRIARLVVTKLFGTVTGKRIGVLGFAFKAVTNDTRESPAIRICRDLLEEGAILQILDPKVEEGQIGADLGQPAGEGSCQRVADLHQAASGADALLLLTESQQFAQIDWPALAAVMRKPAWLFDARAKANGAAARAAGLNVWTVGEG